MYAYIEKCNIDSNESHHITLVICLGACVSFIVSGEPMDRMIARLIPISRCPQAIRRQKECLTILSPASSASIHTT